MNVKPSKFLIAPTLAVSLCTSAMAQMQPMDDTALEETIGQAYIEMESYTDVDSNQISRLTFGQTIKIQANADSLELGNLGVNNIDIAATNLSLGYIDTATNQIVPFEFSDPYLEWATNATNDVVGFRVGFGDAKGIMQMDLTSFSGNIGMQINGEAPALYSSAAGLQSNEQATYIGTTSGACTDGTDCVSLANIQSLSVADSDSTGTADFFLAFQKLGMNWNTSTGTQAATQGFFMNVPTDQSITISDVNSGTVGIAVEFINRGVGRWNN